MASGEDAGGSGHLHRGRKFNHEVIVKLTQPIDGGREFFAIWGTGDDDGNRYRGAIGRDHGFSSRIRCGLFGRRRVSAEFSLAEIGDYENDVLVYFVVANQRVKFCYVGDVLVGNAGRILVDQNRGQSFEGWNFSPSSSRACSASVPLGRTRIVRWLKRLRCWERRFG